MKDGLATFIMSRLAGWAPVIIIIISKSAIILSTRANERPALLFRSRENIVYRRKTRPVRPFRINTRLLLYYIEYVYSRKFKSEQVHKLCTRAYLLILMDIGQRRVAKALQHLNLILVRLGLLLPEEILRRSGRRRRRRGGGPILNRGAIMRHWWWQGG